MRQRLMVCKGILKSNRTLNGAFFFFFNLKKFFSPLAFSLFPVSFETLVFKHSWRLFATLCVYMRLPTPATVDLKKVLDSFRVNFLSIFPGIISSWETNRDFKPDVVPWKTLGTPENLLRMPEKPNVAKTPWNTLQGPLKPVTSCCKRI